MMRHVFVALIGVFATTSLLFAQPREFSYQGEVRSASGSLIPDGTYEISVRIYDVPVNGTELFGEKHEVAVAKGIVNLYIGSITPLPITLPLDRDLFLGITIGTEPELQPRTKILPAPTALFATQAWEAQRLSPTASGVVKTLNELSGAVRIMGDSTLSLKQVGNVLQFHVEIDPADGVRSLASPEQTLAIQSSTGPNVLLDVANGSITTNKLANGAVTGTKISQLGALTGQVLKWDGSVWKPAPDLGLKLIATSTPISGDGTIGNPIAISQASSTTPGFLSAIDWNLFNAKLTTVSVTPRFTGNGTSASPIELAQQGAAAQEVLKWNGTTWSPAADQIGMTSVQTDATLSGNGTAANQLKIAQQGATAGQVLKWSGTTWLPADDVSGLATVNVRSPELSGSGTSGNPIVLAQQGATSGQVLKWNGTSWSPAADEGVTAVAVNAPLTGSGTTASPISIPQANSSTNGYLSSTDWTTFNNKLSAVAVTPRLTGNGTTGSPLDIAQQGATTGQVLRWNGTTWAPGAGGLTSISVTAPITGDGTTANPLAMAQANGTTNGYLSSTDWTTFNNKLSAVSVTARLTGNGTTANPLDIAQQGATSGQVLKWNGASWSPANDLGGLPAVATDATLAGDGTAGDVLKIAQQGATTGQVLKWNGSTWLPANDNGLQNVSVRSPELAGSGTTLDPIYLAQQGATSGQVLKWNGSSWSPAADAGLTTVAVNSPITGNGTSGSPITIAQANSSTSGYLSSTDWTTFNNKLSSVAVTARLTGNGTPASPLDIAQQGATNGQVLKWNGTSWAPAADAGAAVSTDATLAGDGTAANVLKIAQQGATTGQVLKWNGSTWLPAADNGLATVSVTSPITGSGTAASPLAIAQANGSTNGYLSATDWTTFNNKLSSVAVTPRLSGNGTAASPLDIAQQGATTGQILNWSGTSWVPGAGGLASVSVTAPITGNGTAGNPLAIAQANGSTNGYLSSTDWTTFNNKLSAVAVTARLSGNGTAANPLDIAQQGATSGQVLKWNGSSWAPGTDNSTALANGTVTNSTLRWNGTNWVENTNVLATAGGQVTVNAGVNLNGATSPLQANGAAGTSGHVLVSQGAGATPAWQDPNTLISAWKTSGNTLTGGASTSPNEFFGSTNNYDVIFRSNNNERMRILGSGNVGIGLTNPSESRLVSSSTFPGGSTHRHSGLFLSTYPSGMSDGGVPYNALESRMTVQNNSTVNLIDGSMVAITSLEGTNTNAARAFIGVVAINSSGTVTHGNVEGALGRIFVSPGASGNATLTDARALRSDFWLQSNAVTIQNAYGLYVDVPILSSGVSNNRLNNYTGLFIENLDVGSGTKRVMHYAGSGANVPYVLTDQGRVGIGTTSPNELLEAAGNIRIAASGGNANQLQLQTPGGTYHSTFAAGSQTTAINYTLPTSQPSTNQVLTATNVTGSGPYAVTLGWQSPSGSGWSLTGNSGTTAGTNYLGTSDNQPFEIHVFESDAANKGSKRVMRFEPNGTSANLIAGHYANSVTSGVVGAVLGGGGTSSAANSVSGNYGSVLGGTGNTAALFASVGGGTSNRAMAPYAAIAGGNVNAVTSGQASTIAGGASNNVGGDYSTVAGGYGLTLNADNSFGFLGGGNGVTIDSDHVAFFGNVDLWLGGTDNIAHSFRFYEAQSSSGPFPASGSNYTAFKAGTQSANITYTLPTAVTAQNGGLLTSSTGGTMSWSQNLAWDGTNSRLGVNTASPNTKLDVNGDVALRQNTITLGNGNNNNVSVGAFSFIRITGPTGNFTITGIAGGQDGKMIILYNKSGQQMTINHNDNTNSNAGNLILTRNGNNYTTPGGSNYDVVTLIYSTAESAWIISSTY